MGDDQVLGVGFPAARFAADEHVALGQVHVDLLAVLVDAQVHRVEHGQREHRCNWHCWLPPFQGDMGKGRPRAVTRGAASPANG